MTKREFIDLFGEDPEDMFGPDWKNLIEEFTEQKYERSYFLTRLHGTGLENL